MISLLSRALAILVLLGTALVLPLVASAQDPYVEAPSSPDQTQTSPSSAEDRAEIQVKNAELSAIIKIFSKKTKRNYILDDRVKGKVSLFIPSKVSSTESLRILESILALKGFTSVPIGENLWKIIPAKEARQTTIPTKTVAGEELPTAAMVTRLIKLNYVGADEAQQLVSQLVSPDGLINAYAGSNSLVVIDSEDNIERIAKIVAELDIPFSNRELTIIPIVHADAKGIAEKLSEILGEGEKKQNANASSGDSTLDLLRARLRDSGSIAPPTPVNPGTPGSMTTLNDSRRGTGGSVGSRSRAPKIIADERTNSIVVVADEDMTARIRALISKLDSKVDLSGNRFYVYRCQHANAEELAAVLGGLVGGGGAGVGAGAGMTGGGFGGGAALGGGQGGNQGSAFGGGSQGGGSQRGGGGGFGNNRAAQGPTSVSLGENVSVTADPATNSLVIQAGKTDYEKIKQLLSDLDVKRRQVLVEAILLEVSVADSQSTSVEFRGSAGGSDGGILTQNTFGNLANLFSNPTSISQFSVAAASAGTLNLGGIKIPSQTVLLNAAQSNQNVNILSSPTILATDNEQAEIIVGRNVPFLASVSSSRDNLNNTFNQVDRQDVGITLRLTPQISSNNFVNLRLYTEVSALVDDAQNVELGPTTTKRSSETTVITKDNQMVVIGGLMADDQTDAEAGVPYFKDIPVLGHLFRRATERRSRTNLLIFITPRIIRDQFDARDATTELRGTVENEIERNEVFPDRQDILRRDTIDNVMEAEQFTGAKPTTIFPPQSAKPRGEASKPSANADDTDIEISVSPQLPEVASEPRARLGSPPQALTRNACVVLDISPLSAKERQSLPTPQSAGRSVFGVVVPSESDRSAMEFFSAGRTYTFGSLSKSLRALGSFASREEATAVFPELEDAASWHTLSPHEIMNLGSGPWRLRSPASLRAVQSPKGR